MVDVIRGGDRRRAVRRSLAVPTLGDLAVMSDAEAAAVFSRTQEPAVRLLVIAEMGRRDVADQRAAAERARKERARKERERRAAARAEYDRYVDMMWLAAEQECNGYLLSRAGKRANANPVKLWSMADRLAYRYASEELLDFWGRHGRLTYAEWQQQARMYRRR